MRAILLCCALMAVAALLAPAPASATTPPFSMAEPTGFQLVGKSNQTALYEVLVTGYDWPIQVISLRGERWQQGYDYGVLLGHQTVANYETLMASMIEEATEVAAVEMFLDWQWNEWLSKQMPSEYAEEVEGMRAGGQAAQTSADLGVLFGRMQVLANFPGTIDDIIYVLEDEAVNALPTTGGAAPNIAQLHPRLPEMLAAVLRLRWSPMMCSMMGAWGSRTVNGQLFSFRNLDWNSDTGLQQRKLVTVFHPPEAGRQPHVTLGYAGLVGSLAGMSAAGLTAHEANLEESRETFRGFPWLVRLRYIMENAVDLAGAKALWEATNNTVGYNHMIGSANDAKAMCMETMAWYTAYFEDNDPREAAATWKDPATGQVYQLGFPLVDAVWRTNAGFDPTTRKYYTWGVGPTTNSQLRYMYVHNALVQYQQQGTLIDELQAVNITSILGQKGAATPYQCPPPGTNTGSNVLSVTFNPAELRLWSAWENGHNSTWSPAGCNTYVLLDMAPWFGPQDPPAQPPIAAAVRLAATKDDE